MQSQEHKFLIVEHGGMRVRVSSRKCTYYGKGLVFSTLLYPNTGETKNIGGNIYGFIVSKNFLGYKLHTLSNYNGV